MIPKLNFAVQLLRWIPDAPLKKKHFLLKKIMVKRERKAAHFVTDSYCATGLDMIR
jgi:hypothetical protein